MTFQFCSKLHRWIAIVCCFVDFILLSLVQATLMHTKKWKQCRICAVWHFCTCAVNKKVQVIIRLWLYSSCLVVGSPITKYYTELLILLSRKYHPFTLKHFLTSSQDFRSTFFTIFLSIDFTVYIFYCFRLVFVFVFLLTTATNSNNE